MIGFSFSPGGLLLPYHLGVLAALSYHGHVTHDTPLAGSSAGSIAVAAHAANVPSYVALEASMRLSAQCNMGFVARGQLMTHLRHQLDTALAADAHHRVNARPGAIGLAHLQLYPEQRTVLATQDFDSRSALMDAVCDSSMFPFFTSNRPFRVVKRRHRANSHKRSSGCNDTDNDTASSALQTVVTVDGVFTEPLWRFGCPDQQKQRISNLERSVCVSVFPKELTGLGQASSPNHNVIAPPLQVHNIIGQVTHLGRLACTPGSRQELKLLYEQGWENAEAWVCQEERGYQSVGMMVPP